MVVGEDEDDDFEGLPEDEDELDDVGLVLHVNIFT